MSAPALSVVIPTRGRPDYLAVALGSLACQAGGAELEVIVVDDRSPGDATAGVAADAGARVVRLEPPGGLNAARNAGAAAAGAELVAYVDDDVAVPAEWAAAVIAGAARFPDAEAFGGPIRARLEGPAPRGCGREEPPITTLDLGSADREAELVWGSNMAVRRAALDRIGPFDESIAGGGDEEEWLDRLRAAGGRVVYLAAAGLEHRRAGDDARLRSLAREAYRRGRAMRRYDGRVGKAPGLGRELRVVAGCGWHTVRRACPQGIVMGAHAVGRTVEAVRGRA
jgi:GT2 family glycosyltransferase